MNSLISRIPLYISYFLNVVDEHSLHPPFIYDLYTKIIKGGEQPVKEIEAIRKELLNSDEVIKYHSYGEQSSLNEISRSRIASITRSGINKASNSSLFVRLVKFFECKSIIELGTSLGINTSYLALADKSATVYTFEGHSQLIEKARSTFDRLSITNVEIIKGNIDETLPDFLKRIKKIDFILLDANHQKEATWNYFSYFIPWVHENSVMVIDDIRWNKEMYDAWNVLKDHDKVSLSVDLMDLGLLFFSRRMKKQHYTLKK